jgi:hypothetical protein
VGGPTQDSAGGKAGTVSRIVFFISIQLSCVIGLLLAILAHLEGW